MSVRAAKLCTAPEAISHHFNWPGVFLAVITVQTCWDSSQQVKHESKPGDTGHCEVIGEKPVKLRRDWAKLATTIPEVPPALGGA